MTDPTALIAGVLQEISADAPTGQNVHKDYSRQEGRYTPITIIERFHGKLKSYLEQLEQAMQRGTSRPDPNEGREASEEVIKLSLDCMANESKDLWVAAYLLHALTAGSGISGLRVGLHLLTQLITNFGDSLHPQPINERSLNRLCQVADLLVRCVELAPLTDEANGSYCYRDKILADFLYGKPEAEVGDYVAHGAVFPSQLEDAWSESSDEFMGNLADDLDACLKEIDSYGNALASIVPAGSRLPNHSPLKKKLTTFRDLITPYLPQPAAAEATAPGEASGSNAASAISAGAAVSSRQEALERLREIARFFEETEPHSPISYSLRRAIDWGNRPLSDVLGELLPESDLEQLKLRAGIPLPGEESGRSYEAREPKSATPQPKPESEEQVERIPRPGDPDWVP